MTNLDLNKCVVNTEGRIDVQATCDKITEALEAHQAEQDELFAQIAPQVAAVFDKFVGAYLNTPSVVSQAAMNMGANVQNLRNVEELVKTYLSANSGKAEDGALFTVKRGKGGGICRNNEEDVAARAAAKAASESK